MIHSAERKSKSHCLEMGHGSLPEDITDIAVCPDKSYTLIYNGEVPSGKYAQFEIPWTGGITGNVKFRWTIAVSTKVDPHSPDDYTSSSVEVSFYPNSRKYIFTDPTTKKQKKLDIDKKKDEVEKLERAGWKRSTFPASDSTKNPYSTEAELRSVDFKWDTLDYRENSKTSKNINFPVFHVHALTRGKRSSNPKVKFALILTVEAPKSKIDIYQNIIKNYSALAPLNLQLRSTVSVRK